MGLFTIWTRVRPEFIFLEIDHQVRLAGGQYPLYGGGQLAFMVVEGADEPSKDRSVRACGYTNHNHSSIASCSLTPRIASSVADPRPVVVGLPTVLLRPFGIIGCLEQWVGRKPISRQ